MKLKKLPSDLSCQTLKESLVIFNDIEKEFIPAKIEKKTSVPFNRLFLKVKSD